MAAWRRNIKSDETLSDKKAFVINETRTLLVFSNVLDPLWAQGCHRNRTAFFFDRNLEKYSGCFHFCSLVIVYKHALFSLNVVFFGSFHLRLMSSISLEDNCCNSTLESQPFIHKHTFISKYNADSLSQSKRTNFSSQIQSLLFKLHSLTCMQSEHRLLLLSGLDMVMFTYLTFVRYSKIMFNNIFILFRSGTTLWPPA